MQRMVGNLSMETSNPQTVHGNIKSPNIFLNYQQYSCVSYLGLAITTSPLAPHIARATSYCAPEVANPQKVLSLIIFIFSYRFFHSWISLSRRFSSFQTLTIWPILKTSYFDSQTNHPTHIFGKPYIHQLQLLLHS